MRVASLVIERADLQRRLAEAQARLLQQAKRQEGDPDPLLGSRLDDAAGLSERVRDLTVQINEANTANGNMGRIAMRDDLDRQLRLLREVLNASRVAEMRGRPTEIRWIPNIDAAILEARIDGLARQRRQLNEAIQATDWTE